MKKLIFIILLTPNLSFAQKTTTKHTESIYSDNSNIERYISDMKKIENKYKKDAIVTDKDDAKRVMNEIEKDWQKINQYNITADNKNMLMAKKSAASSLKRFQTSMFPKFRKVIVKYIDKELWLDNSGAIIGGKNNDAISFWGIQFSPNRRKKEALEASYPILKTYRFKKASYRSLKDYKDDEIYWNIDSKKDTSVVLYSDL